MTTLLLLSLLQALLLPLLPPLPQDTPTLQQRSTPPPPAAHTAPAHDTLPPSAEGEYRWRETGEIIELFVDDHQLHGYLTRRSDRGNPRSAPLTFTFTQASAQTGHIYFTTRELHGDSYSFSGLLRPNPPAPRQGPWLLQGTLTLHSGSATSTQAVFAALTPSGAAREE